MPAYLGHLAERSHQAWKNLDNLPVNPEDFVTHAISQHAARTVRSHDSALDRYADGNGLLQRGRRGDDVVVLQKALRAQGHAVEVDGVFGPQTERAVRAFQQQAGLLVDGLVGPETVDALRLPPGPARDKLAPTHRQSGMRAPTEAELQARPEGSMRAATLQEPMPVRGRTAAAGANRTAVITETARAGQRNQMATGQITVNGRSYDFRSGGFGKGNLPRGEYTVTPHMWSRNDRSMSVGGVGYSFALTDKYDARVGATRTLLRIHPDGGAAGTLGCIGIVGGADVQRRFRDDMRAELQRNGGRFTLSVR